MRKLLLVAAIWSLSGPVLADIFDVPKVQTVMNRKYDVKNEITLEFAYLPKDPFSKYIGFGASYTHAFSEFTSWEVINAIYDLELASGLKKQLLEYTPPYPPSMFAVQQYQLTSNIVFSPVYTKNLLFNSSIVYSQFSFVMGGGITGFSLALAPTIDAGFILRFFLSPTKFFKFDLRYNKFLTTLPAITDNYTIIFGYSFNLGGDK